MGLSDDLGRILTPLPGTFGVFARNLGTGEVAEVNADQVLPTESAAKVFILLHYSGLVAAGECDPSTRVVLPDNFQINGTGVLRYLAPGLSLCLDDLAWLMTIVSDNVATALLMLEVGGPEAVNKTMGDLGLTTARLATFDEMLAGEPFGTSTARDLAEAYTHLDDGCREAGAPTGPDRTAASSGPVPLRRRPRGKDAGASIQQDRRRSHQLHRLRAVRNRFRLLDRGSPGHRTTSAGYSPGRSRTCCLCSDRTHSL